MRPWPLVHIAASFVVFRSVARFPRAEAADLVACGTRLLEQHSAAQNATNATESPSILSISYEQCLAECGPGMGNIRWQFFSQTFGAWFLPWISLMFQIPFGAERPVDDVVAFLITMGSPALAAYSLQITHLNKYWITTAFLDIKYPNSQLIPTVLAAFHHIPIKVDYEPPFLHSLIVLAKNDEYWARLAAANKSRRWSIPLVMSYILVIFSLILTVIDSFVTRPSDSGYGIATVWSFLLPLVIGWLHIGCEPEPSHLRNSLAAANQSAWVAAEDRAHPIRMKSPMPIEFAGPDDIPAARKDELKPVPVFNYSRAFVTPMTAEVVLRLMKNAAANARQEIPVGNSVEAGVLPWVEGKGDETLPENRAGTTTEVVSYSSMVFQPPRWNPGSITPLKIQSPEMSITTNPLLEHGLVSPARWAPGIWKRVLIASTLALGLQWGTTGAAVLVHYIAPPPGLGCRAFSFLLYGIAGTISFFLFLTSSILAQMSRPLPEQVPVRSWSHSFQETGAVVCRRLGKFISFTSAIGILLVCFFQVTDAFNNCFCNSTTFDIGKHFVVFSGINFTADSRTLGLWITGLVVAFVTTIFFLSFDVHGVACPPMSINVLFSHSCLRTTMYFRFVK